MIKGHIVTDNPSPTKRCATCGEHKPVALFSKNKQHPDGFQTRCKACVRLENQGYREKNGDTIRARERTRYEANTEAILEQQRAYRAANAEMIRQRRRKYNITHTDMIREQNRKYRTANVEAIRAKHDAYRTANADMIAKRCPKCEQTKPLASFSRSDDKKDGYKLWCKECISLSTKASGYRKVNADAIREYQRNYRAANAEMVREKKRQRHENNPDMRRAAHQRRRALKKGNGGEFSAKELRDMRIAQNGVCAYCRRHLDPQALTIDHVIPLHQGGRHEAANIVLACGVCNRSKGARRPDEWLHRWYER